MKTNTTNPYQLLFLICFLFTACHFKQEKKVSRPKRKAVSRPAAISEEDQVINLILNMEEVKHKSAEVKTDSKGKRHLEAYVETPPNAKDHRFWIKVSEDNGNNLVAYYTFAVQQKSHQISYYDAVNDTLVPLSKWRQDTPLEER